MEEQRSNYNTFNGDDTLFQTIAILGIIDNRKVILQHDPEQPMPWRLDVDGNGKYFQRYEYAMAWAAIERYNAKRWKNKLPAGRNKDV